MAQWWSDGYSTIVDKTIWENRPLWVQNYFSNLHELTIIISKNKNMYLTPIPKSMLTVTSCQFAGERFRRCNSIEFRVGGRREAFKLSSLLFACTWVSKLNFLNNVVATLTFNFKSYLPRPRIHPRDIFYNTFLQGGSTTVCTNVECHLAVTNVSQFYTKMKSFAFYSKDKTASTGATYISRCWGLWNLIIHLAKATFLVILLLCSTENHLKCHFSEQD